MELTLKFTDKQQECLKYWLDANTEEILFGGGKGGGKTFFVCSCIFGDALLYPDTYYFIARAQLTDLRKYTIPSIHEVFAKQFQIDLKRYAKYNGQDNYYHLYNNSRVYLLACEYLPGDPLFERFGSMQMTRGAIEEGGEISHLAKQNLKVSLGRKNNDKYNLKAKMLVVGNPKKNWMKTEFIMPYNNGTLPDNRKYIQALYLHNTFREPGYDAILNSISDKIARQRLILGDWNYGDESPGQLVKYDAILDLFTNEWHKPNDNDKKLSADIALQGRDRFVVGMWRGMVFEIKTVMEKSKATVVESRIRGYMLNHKIPASCVVVDSDGLGAYLGSYLDGIREFHAQNKAWDNEYANLKSQCAYQLAELINNHAFKIICDNDQWKEMIVEELQLLIAKNVDADEKKKRIITKDEMKAIIGRSPDFLDTLVMSMSLFLKAPNEILAFG